MQVRNRHPRRQRLGDQVDFQKQMLDLSGERGMTRRKHRIAAAAQGADIVIAFSP
jgi:hypothetical protein